VSIYKYRYISYMSKLLNWDTPKVNAKYKAETINGISYTLWKQALWKYIHRLDLGLGTLNILKCVKEKKMKSNLQSNIHYHQVANLF